MKLLTREEYEFLRFKLTQDIIHLKSSERLVAIHNLMQLMALYAPSDELEEIFVKPLLGKLEEKLNSPVHGFAEYIPPKVRIKPETMFNKEPWPPYPYPNCGNTNNG